MKSAASFLSGLLFAIGLGWSGMVQPQKVLGFLDVAGRWDPSLAFVMLGAVAVHGIAWRFLRRTRTVDSGARIDAPLLAGAAVFGAGWVIPETPSPMAKISPAKNATTLCLILIVLLPSASSPLPRACLSR